MDIITIILLLIAIVMGFFVGKYVTDRIKWGDKKKLIEQEWDSKLKMLEKDYEGQLKDLKKDNEMELNKLSHDWQLRYSTELAEIKELIQGAEKYMREDAIKRSRRTLLGKLWEQVSPYIPKFPFKPSDMKFMGSPIDFVIFDGMGEKDIKQVIFLEVKSGDSKLNSQERKLKEVIEDGKVKWRLFNIDKPEKIEIEKVEEEEAEEDEVTPNELYQHIDEKIASVKEPSEEDENEEDN